MPDTFVLDCSVAAKWVLPEPGRDPALRLLERYASGEISLITPDLLLAEFASLMAERSRRKQISTEPAQHACELMTRSAPRLFAVLPRLLRASSPRTVGFSEEAPAGTVSPHGLMRSPVTPPYSIINTRTCEPSAPPR